MNWKKGDWVVIAAVVIVIMTLLGLRELPAASGARLLQVKLDGEMIDEIPFDVNSTEMFQIKLPAGEASVEIDSGRVRVLPMPRHICPLGICSSIGWVEQSGDAIVCLPNRLVLTVVGGETNEFWDSLDGVTK